MSWLQVDGPQCLMSLMSGKLTLLPFAWHATQCGAGLNATQMCELEASQKKILGHSLGMIQRRLWNNVIEKIAMNGPMKNCCKVHNTHGAMTV